MARPLKTELSGALIVVLKRPQALEVPMRLSLASFIAAMTLALAGQASAVERKPCGHGEQEVMAKDRTVMCVKAIGARPGSKGDVAYQGFPSASASANLKR